MKNILKELIKLYNVYQGFTMTIYSILVIILYNIKGKTFSVNMNLYIHISLENKV